MHELHTQREAATQPKRPASHEPQMRHRRPAQRRQVDAVQRADQGRHRRRELSVLHDRAQRRHRRGARPAARGARRDREAGEGACRRPSSSSTSRGSSPARRRARASATSSSPTSARPTRSRTSCAASRTTNVVHVAGKVDPVSDIETINTELALADLAAVEKQLAKVEKLARAGGDKEAQRIVAVLEKVEAALERGAARRAPPISTPRSRTLLKPFFLLTMKPTMYVANVAEHGFHDNPLLDARRARTRRRRARRWSPICAALEARDRRSRRRRQARVPRRHGLDRAGARPRDPRRLQAARPADVLHRRAEGSARMDDPRRRRRRRRRRA